MGIYFFKLDPFSSAHNERELEYFCYSARYVSQYVVAHARLELHRLVAFPFLARATSV